MIKIRITILAGFLILLLAGCSGTGNPSSPPLAPDIDKSSQSGLSLSMETESFSGDLSMGSILPSLDEPVNSDGHDLIGIWRVRLWNDGSIEIIPRRTELAHWNITDMILNCPTCFTIAMGPPPGPDQFDFQTTLTNPTGITGYDVTGIIRASGDIEFLNPDSYTFIYSYPGDTIPNPYGAWDTGVGNREFAGYADHTEQFLFEKGGITKFGEIDFLFQASWPGNQEEPYEIRNFSASGDLLSDSSNGVDLQCDVGDWQDNVASVTVDLTAIGGSQNEPMNFTGGSTWTLTDVSYSPTGQGVGEHLLEVAATSEGVSTYNYIPVTVVSAGPIVQGPFEIIYQNLPMEEPNGPTDGMDIAVMGADDGTQTGMVFGGDDTYHFWNTDYSKGTFGLYYESSGEPIKPFDLPNWRFDFADSDMPDTTVDSIFNLSWGECNNSTEILDGDSIPNVVARQRIALWYLNEGNLKLTSNVLVIGADPGPPTTYTVIVRPIEFASGFREDGLLYMTLAYDSGEESEFPIVDIMALKPPLDFQDNPNLVSGGYEVALDEGSGTDKISRTALVGVDVDDSNIMPITGGYAGHAWVAVAEAGSENVLEIIDADIDTQNNVFITVNLPATPLDVEILPLTKIGEPSNLICVLCTDNLIHLYDYAGNYAGNAGGPPYMTGNALRLDIDDKNLAVHVLHQGASYPMVTVYKWDE